MSNNLIYATWGIAEEFLQHGHVIESIMCLEGLCKKVNFDIKPIDEVETRLRLSQILIKYTTNISRAKSHLERAVCIVHT
jgi:MAternally-affected-uncoordination protein